MEHAFGLNIPRSLEELCDRTRTALIVYDMQVGIVSQITDGQSIIERVAVVRQAARERGVRVVYTRQRESQTLATVRPGRSWRPAS